VSELVALCFDADASPSIRFQPSGSKDRSVIADDVASIYGWGLAWYPSSERGASVIKDPTSAGGSTVDTALGEWRRFRSTLFVCHLRGHRRPRNQEDAQPFVRSYGGRQWVFAHDGDLVSDWARRFALPDDPAFDPLGRTDSEHAFCWLLSRMHAQRARTLSEVAPEELLGWMRELNAGGQMNALLTDGDHLVVYHDAESRGSLHWTRRIPPHPTTELVSDAVRIELDAPEDPNRTALVFASEPLSPEPWRAASPGELLIARRGAILWASGGGDETHPGAGPAQRAPGQPGQVEAGQQLAAAEPLPVLTPVTAVRSRPAVRELQIVHHTTYQYSLPVERSSHRLLLRPVEDHSQQLLDYSVTVVPAARSSEYEDVFGNAAMAVEIAAPYQELQVESRASVRVRTLRSLEQRAAHGRHAIPLAWMPWQRQMLSAYLLPSELPETQLQELSEFAMSFVERNDYDLVGTLLDLNQTLYGDFEYLSGSTTNETTPFQVYESRRGVCQDFANLMICLARLLHVPARYRMGYIFTGGDYENKIQSEASHAWVELYLPRVGWHGFDPTNGIQVGADHVRVACGRGYRDATPTSGTIYRGGGTETLTVSVRVEEVTPGVR
jgi:transglutaminase-like putative cysteine protease/predicted glutamine amidotransferase